LLIWSFLLRLLEGADIVVDEHTDDGKKHIHHLTNGSDGMGKDRCSFGKGVDVEAALKEMVQASDRIKQQVGVDAERDGDACAHELYKTYDCIPLVLDCEDDMYQQQSSQHGEHNDRQEQSAQQSDDTGELNQHADEKRIVIPLFFGGSGEPSFF